MRLLVVHLKRSGGHLIVRWLVENTGYTHVNWVNKMNQGCNFRSELVSFEDKGGNTIYTLEDLPIQGINDYRRLINPDISILVYRDPVNCFSSRVRALPKWKDYKDNVEAFHLYEKQLKKEYEFMFNNHKQFGFDFSIHYDLFIQSPSEYSEIIKHILPQTENVTYMSLTNVKTNYGGGSSFKPHQSFEVNQPNPFLSRYHKLSDPEKYRLRWLVPFGESD